MNDEKIKYTVEYERYGYEIKLGKRVIGSFVEKREAEFIARYLTKMLHEFNTTDVAAYKDKTETHIVKSTKVILDQSDKIETLEGENENLQTEIWAKAKTIKLSQQTIDVMTSKLSSLKNRIEETEARMATIRRISGNLLESFKD